MLENIVVAAVSAALTAPSGAHVVTSESTPGANWKWLVTSGVMWQLPDRSWWTDSPVYRQVTKARTYGDVNVRYVGTVRKFRSTRETPAVAWDGVHLFQRYQSQYNLYYGSVARRDGTVVLKKKCPGGSENGGTYYTLAEGRAPQAVGRQFTASVAVKTRADGSVALSLTSGRVVVSAVDRGVGCEPITNPGGVGVRADNVELVTSRFVTSRI